MEQFVGHKWTDHELAVVKEKWLSGWTDAQIATQLQTRTVKGIQAKRRALKLIVGHHPERPLTRSVTIRYSEEDEIDILRRFLAKEPLPSIAASYHITVHALHSKIRRLQEDGKTQARPDKTERECLGCGSMFASSLPKSLNRRCQNCHAALIAGGASFLTAY